MELFFNITWSLLQNKIAEVISYFMTEILQWVVSITNSLWNDPYIVSLLSTSRWIGRGVFFLAFLIMIGDIAEDWAAGKMVFPSVIVMNVLKAEFFIELAPVIGQRALVLCDTAIDRINLSSSLSTMGQLVLSSFAGTNWITIGGIAFIVGTIVFLCKSLRRFGVMLIQILTCTLYIPSIIRGDTTAMGAWMRQTIAIALTFFFEYLLYYFGLMMFSQFNILLACSFWLAMGMVARILDKYGLSQGSGGGMGATLGTAVQGAVALAK